MQGSWNSINTSPTLFHGLAFRIKIWLALGHFCGSSPRDHSSAKEKMNNKLLSIILPDQICLKISTRMYPVTQPQRPQTGKVSSKTS